MEAASRPALEPLADLPVEEPFGLNGTASQVGRARPPPSTATASPPTPSKGPTNPDEDLLAYGVLLDSGTEASPASPPTSTPPTAPSTSMPDAPYDSVLIPTLLLSSAELLDPEVL